GFDQFPFLCLCLAADEFRTNHGHAFDFLYIPTFSFPALEARATTCWPCGVMPGIDVPRETSADRGGHVAQVGTGFSAKQPIAPQHHKP
ncbi:hypothetical protein ACYTTR_15730, partial [Cobetia marina]